MKSKVNHYENRKKLISGLKKILDYDNKDLFPNLTSKEKSRLGWRVKKYVVKYLKSGYIYYKNGNRYIRLNRNNVLT